MSAAKRMLAAPAAAAVCSLALAACGGDDPGPGPAAAVPADAPLYADAVIDPDEDARSAINSSLGMLAETDAETLIASALEDLLADAPLSWSEDIEPWAGERAGIFVLDFGDDADGAVVIEVDDEDEMRSTFERVSGEEGGERFELEPDEVAAAADGHAVLGSEAAVDAALAAAEGDSLGDSEAFADATGELSGDRLLTVYAAPGTALELLVAADELSDEQAATIVPALGEAADDPAALAIDATEGVLAGELSAPDGNGWPALAASGLIERAPEDAWLAFGFGDAGPALEAGLAAAGGEAPIAPLGLDLGDLARATADAGGFFAGTSILGISGALLLSERDPGSLAEPLARAEQGLGGDPAVRVEPLDLDGEGFTLMPADAPIQFPFALRDGLLVTALGTDAVGQGFDPQTTVVGSEPFEAAGDELGDDFELTAYLDFTRMRSLLDSLPGFWDDPEMASARPYIERLERLTAGAREENGRSIVRLALAVRDPGGSG